MCLFSQKQFTRKKIKYTRTTNLLLIRLKCYNTEEVPSIDY